MANPLIKQNKQGGYGYQGYGYGEDVPLLPSGKRNLSIALVILFLGLAWLGYRFLIWQEIRQLSAANISWDRAEPQAAWEHLESVGLWAVDREAYNKTRLTLLLERDPASALAFAREVVAQKPKKPLRDPTFAWQALLWASVRAQDWQALATSIAEIDANGALAPESPDLQTAKAWLLLSQQQYEAAWASLQAALLKNPYETEARLLRSELQARTDNRPERNQALVALREIIAAGGANSVRASLLLLSSGLMPDLASDWRDEIQRLAQNPHLEAHYLFQRPAALRATLAGIRGKDAPLAHRFTRQLADLPEATDEEIAEAVFYAQEVGELEESKTTLARYEKNAPTAPLAQWLHARQAWYAHDFALARELCESGLASPQAARFLPLLAAFAQDQDFDIAPETQSSAMRLLLSYLQLSAAQWDFAARALWTLDSTQAASLEKQALAWAKKEPLLASRFLLDHERAESALQALALIPQPYPNEAVELKFRALVLQGSLAKADAWLETAANITEFTRLSGKLMLALLAKDEAAIEATWEQAWSFAEKNRSAAAFSALGDLSFEYKKPRRAEQAYQQTRKLAPDLPVPTASLKRFASLELQAQRTKPALDLIAIALEREPHSIELQRQWGYYSTLLNTDVLKAKDILKAVYERRKEDRQITVATAFSFLRTSNKSRALALLERWQAEGPGSDAERAVYYAALIANGKTEKAEAVRTQIDDSKLLPEERALIEEFSPVVFEKITLPNQAEDARLSELKTAPSSEKKATAP